ncbi:hypothetical protein SPAR91_0139 [Streptococcus pneumoniae GA47283]|nr:hypothetical protein SPAR91_0139 [Streptococcus pneumoniae GA47283]
MINLFAVGETSLGEFNFLTHPNNLELCSYIFPFPALVQQYKKYYKRLLVDCLHEVSIPV